MTTRTKSILIIAGTLVVGLVIGALATGALIGSRVDQFRQMREHGGLPRMIEDVIRPTDEVQRRRITEALDSMEARQSRLRDYTFEQHMAIFDTMNADLDSILTPEQRQRLDQWHRSDRSPHGDRRGPGGPPFGPPGDRPPGHRPDDGGRGPNGRPRMPLP